LIFHFLKSNGMKQITTGAPGRTTLVAQACAKVQGFSDMYRRFKRRMKTSGRSESKLNNYIRHIGQMALHFGCLPTDLEDDQIEDYLYLLQQQHDTPSATTGSPPWKTARLPSRTKTTGLKAAKSR
jgi:hypothetical protein